MCYSPYGRMETVGLRRILSLPLARSCSLPRGCRGRSGLVRGELVGAAWSVCSESSLGAIKSRGGERGRDLGEGYTLEVVCNSRCMSGPPGSAPLSPTSACGVQRGLGRRLTRLCVHRVTQTEHWKRSCSEKDAHCTVSSWGRSQAGALRSQRGRGWSSSILSRHPGQHCL